MNHNSFDEKLFDSVSLHGWRSKSLIQEVLGVDIILSFIRQKPSVSATLICTFKNTMQLFGEADQTKNTVHRPKLQASVASPVAHAAALAVEENQRKSTLQQCQSCSKCHRSIMFLHW